MAPFNELGQRIKITENGCVTTNRILTEYKDGWFVKQGTTRFYLKEIDNIVDAIDFDLYDSGKPIDQSNEIVWTLKDKLLSISEELKRVKGICIEWGVCID